MTSTPYTAYSARGWHVIGLLRMALAVLALVLAGAAALPLVLAMHGAWGRLAAALLVIHS